MEAFVGYVSVIIIKDKSSDREICNIILRKIMC